MMLGIKGQTKKNIYNSFIKLNKWGVAKIRATAYSPKEIIHELDKFGKVKIDDILQYDKMTYLNSKIKNLNYSQYLQLIYNTKNFEEILKN